MNHNQFALCEDCVQRNCNKVPKLDKSKTFKQYKCDKYRKHQEGFKLEEVMHEKDSQMGK